MSNKSLFVEAQCDSGKVFLKVINETALAYVTKTYPRLGIDGETPNDKRKGIVRFSKSRGSNTIQLSESEIAGRVDVYE